MSDVGEPGRVDEPSLLTLSEAIKVLRIGRSLGYELARQYLASGGTSGLPVIRLGEQCLRVPRWALLELATTGRVVRLCDAPVPVEMSNVDG
ncbi:MAG: hypothetical protein AAGF73_17375 [Actinomycetota bacterium]